MKSVAAILHDDQQTAITICAANGWRAQQPFWLGAYTAYDAVHGNPKLLSRTAIQPDIDEELYDLYESAIGQRIATTIRDLSVGSCPVCGSSNTGTVDHFLPRRAYPEYSIFGPNLVPACTACNMFSKRGKFVGPGLNDYLLHPYYEEVVKSPLWQVRFLPRFEAVRFEAVPVDGLGPAMQARVRFHLDTVLAKEFQKWMEHSWPTHIESLVREAQHTKTLPITEAFVRDETSRQLRYASAGGNHNSWPAAFYRGILKDASAIAYLAQQVTLMT